jgi:chondroitin AC lyase
LPKGQQVFVANQQQEGNWYDINHTTSKDIIRKKIFTLGVNHGITPEQATYVPGIRTAENMKSYLQKNNIEILANTENVQVVRNKKTDIWQMIFYNAGEFTHKDMTVKVDKGCALIIKKIDKDKIKLHIADPAQTQSNITVKIDAPKRSGTINCDFSNSDIYAGRTQTFDIRLK